MILVTGAAGKTGRAVVATTSRTGARVRAFVRAVGQVEELRESGATEVVVGDFSDSASLCRAVSGCSAIYHLCPNVHPEEVAIGRSMIEAARDAAVERFVFHSVLHPQIRAMPHHWKKLEVEELLLESGLPFTILQPTAYLQNLLAQWPAITEEGRFSRPYSVEARVAMVDLEDVAEVACRVLTEPGHLGAIYELCGAELLDGAEIAAVLGRVLGREVVASAQPREEWAEAARGAGLGDYQVETLLAMFRHYERHGLVGNPKVLENLLGRSCAGLEGWARRQVERAESSG